MGQRKCRIELDRLLVERFHPRDIVMVAIRPAEYFVRLEIKQIGVAVLRRLAFDLLLFARRKRRLQRGGDFLRQLALDGENVG